jgi:hypothetical protein
MNCLSGEKELFTVSNKKDSCTQGIDISSKWLTLSDFSKLDNDSVIKTSSESECFVGFVDAEGQGDRDVTYDSELVCPILLLSKVVIFNWKGDLQKDLILQTLGIMCRAAKNVGDETGSASARKPFGHLHIVFRDWQSVETDQEEVLSDLLKPENTQAGKARDLIRAELQQCFTSIRAWLFDAPAAERKKELFDAAFELRKTEKAAFREEPEREEMVNALRTEFPSIFFTSIFAARFAAPSD